MEVGPGVKNFKPGDKVVSAMSQLVSVEAVFSHISFISSCIISFALVEIIWVKSMISYSLVRALKIEESAPTSQIHKA